MGASSAAKAVGENVLVDESKAGNLPDDAIETFADPTKGTADALSQVESRLRNGLMLAIVGTMLASIIAALVVVVIVRRVGR